MEGVITELNVVRGRGLIQTPDGNQIGFTKASVHGMEFNQLRRGQPVAFELQLGFDGPDAVAVRPSSNDPMGLGGRQAAIREQ